MNDLPEKLKPIVKGGGSLTSLPIIETQAGDVSAYRRAGGVGACRIKGDDPESTPDSQACRRRHAPDRGSGGRRDLRARPPYRSASRRPRECPAACRRPANNTAAQNLYL